MNYVPGVTQTIKITLSHPEGIRWGFQITARLASDETKTAGEFASNSVAKVICDDGSSRGAPAPCQTGQLQFAVHADAPRTDAGAGFTFSIDWTPPATDVGDVIFYAAGNAANGSNSNAGDRVYTTARRISPPCSLAQKPSVLSAVNGASFQAAWSGGAMMTIFGSNFGPAGRVRGVTAADIVDQRYPQSLACIAVTVNGLNAPVAYVQPDQINFQAPEVASVGNASVVVIANPGAANELRSDPMMVSNGQTFAPAFFTFNGKSIAATTADGSKILADPSVVPGGVAPKAGDIVVLYGTGLGATNPPSMPGDIASVAARLINPVTVTVGGLAVPASDILYAGLSPQSISGLVQINIKLPASLPDGDTPVILSAGGAQSPPGTTIPIRN